MSEHVEVLKAERDRLIGKGNPRAKDMQLVFALDKAIAALAQQAGAVVAYMEPRTLNAVDVEDYAELCATYPGVYDHWFPVARALSSAPGGGGETHPFRSVK